MRGRESGFGELPIANADLLIIDFDSV